MNMENASLRIKFRPILKHVDNNNDSKCTIEIVPEISGYQNLDKIEWQLDDGIIEYTIPMTYKIYIKKENNTSKIDMGKTYYSCVDLLHAYSLSNTNFASGDVTRITSDNFIFSKITSDVERCDIILTKKDLYNSSNTYEKITEIVQRSESSQTLNMKGIDGKTESIQTHDINKYDISTIDRSMQIDIINFEPILVVKKDPAYSKPPNTSEDNDAKSTEKLNISNENPKTEEIHSKPDSTKSKSSKQRLSLAPMCSIDARETATSEKDKRKKSTLITKTVSNTNIFKEFIQSLSGGDNCDPFCRLNEQYFEYIVLDKAGNIFQPLTDNPDEHKRLLTEKNDPNSSNRSNPAELYVNQKYQKLKQTAALNDIIYKAQNYDGLKTMSVNDFNIIWNPHNQSRLIELQNTVVTLQGNDYEDDDKYSQKPSLVKAISSRIKSKDKDSFTNETMRTIKPVNNKFRSSHVHKPENLEFHRRISDIFIPNKSRISDCTMNSYFSNKLSNRVPQNVRVSQFVKYLEKEVHPFVSELNDIRNKCVSYGLFTRDMIPCQTYDMNFKSLPSTEQDNKIIENQTSPKFENVTNDNQVIKYPGETSMGTQSKVTEYQSHKKPNRVVYSIFFND